MKISVEFYSKEDQPHSDNPIPIAVWKLKTAEFPVIGHITERHLTGANAAIGGTLERKHRRLVVINDREGGFVSACPEQGCWDARRFGSRLISLNYSFNKGFSQLELQEIVR